MQPPEPPFRNGATVSQRCHLPISGPTLSDGRDCSASKRYSDAGPRRHFMARRKRVPRHRDHHKHPGGGTEPPAVHAASGRYPGGMAVPTYDEFIEPRLMIEHGVGVSHRQLRIAKLDSDYFEE